MIERIEQASVRRRQNALAEFFLHDGAFGFKVLVINGQAGQSFGFGPQEGLEIVRWHRFKIDGDVVRSKGVVLAAHVFGQAVHHLGLHVPGGLEHDVLKEVRKSAAMIGIIF